MNKPTISTLTAAGTAAPITEEPIAAAIRAGCSAADLHLECSYPTCMCKNTPTIVRAALAEYWRATGRR